MVLMYTSKKKKKKVNVCFGNVVDLVSNETKMSWSVFNERFLVSEKLELSVLMFQSFFLTQDEIRKYMKITKIIKKKKKKILKTVAISK